MQKHKNYEKRKTETSEEEENEMNSDNDKRRYTSEESSEQNDKESFDFHDRRRHAKYSSEDDSRYSNDEDDDRRKKYESDKSSDSHSTTHSKKGHRKSHNHHRHHHSGRPHHNNTYKKPHNLPKTNAGNQNDATTLGNKLTKRLNVKLEGKSVDEKDIPAPAVKSFHARTSEEHHNSPSQIPEKIFTSVCEKFGKPSCRCETFAYWNESDLQNSGFKKFVSVEVRARGVEHNTPVLHSDHVYIYVECDIKLKYIAEVLGLSDTITYDRGAHVLGARCAGWKTNIATLLLATEIALGKSTLKSLQEKHALTKLAKKAANDSNKAQKYLVKLQDNLTNL